MAELRIKRLSQAQETARTLYGDLSRRLSVAPVGNCPVDMTAAFVRLCMAQSCGKCVPCRVGLDRLLALLEKVLDGKATRSDLRLIETTAQTIADSADCAIGFESAKLVLDGMRAFRDDYLAHIDTNGCTAAFEAVPCVAGCPAHVDVPAYIGLIAQGRNADAVRVIRNNNPFPAVCALVCEHPCEHFCRREMVDAPINIRGLKRYAWDHAGDVPAPACAPATGKKVAVIGGGPSGLTAAYYLRLMGHEVDLFERRKRLGGMMRYGIPRYRLPDDYLDGDINVILSTGVKVHTDTNIGGENSLEALRKQYDSVYIAIGAHAASSLGLEGEQGRGVMSAVELLREMGDDNRPDFTGKRVVVIGGGNVAMDVTRTSMRLGAASVTCVYRRRVEDMTALPEEVEGAIAEGCEVLPLMSPVRIELDENEQVTAFIGQKQVIGPVKWGRPAPRNANCEETRIPCDIIVMAVGQAIDSADLAQEGIPVNRKKIVADEAAVVQQQPGVFAGGDCVAGPETVIRAIEAGRVAAMSIDAYLGGNGLQQEHIVPPAGYRFQMATGRVGMMERPAEDRKDDFDLMEFGMTDEEACQECARCLRCDHYGYGAMRHGRE